MYKKFFEGLLFGAGFTVSMITIIWLYSYFSMQQIANSINEYNHLSNVESQPTNKVKSESKELSAPPIKGKEQYLGSTAVFSSRFKRGTGAVLPKGSGKIIGKVFANNKPIEGVTLRLALNGSHMSQWAVSDKDGRYEVPVPNGEYRIDGFSLNTRSSEKLSGLILHPNMSTGSEEEFTVSKERSGEGLTFRFVSPVKRLGKHQVFKLEDDIKVKWESYPNADKYEVQILEKSEPHSYKTKPLFKCMSLPEVVDPQINLKNYGVSFKPDHYYIVDVKAIRSEPYEVLSQMDRKVMGYDFKVTGD